MSKIKIEDIQKQVVESNWKLISTVYKNLKEELQFECNEGHIVYNSWDKMRKNLICPICEQNKFKNQSNIILAKPPNTFRIIALDQATKISGYSIFDNGELVKSGIFSTNLEDEIARDNQIKMWLISIVNNLKPDFVGLEDIQLQNFQGKDVGVTTYKVLAHLQGILMETLFELKVPYGLAYPATWRAALGVKGKARADRKKSMQLLIKKWFDISVTDDEADSIGIGKYFVDNIKPAIKMEDWN